MNAADFLYGFFKEQDSQTAERNGYRFADLVAALDEIEHAVLQWKSQGMDVEGFEDCMPRWRNAVVEACREFGQVRWNPIVVPSSPKDFLSPGDTACLKWSSREMGNSSLKFTEEQRDRIHTLLIDSIEALKAIDNLPDGLVQYLFRLISETKTALDEYEITGDFKLERAFCRLREALDITISHTKPESAHNWNGVKDTLREIGVGFLISAPSLAIDATSIWLQLQQQIGG